MPRPDPALTSARHKTLHEVQHLRAIAVLLVILAHLHQAEARFFADPALGDFAFAGFAGVDVFFVISGFIIHHLYRGLSGLSPRFFLLRANRIYPLYWIFTGLALLGYLVMGPALTAGTEELDVAGSLALVPLGHPPVLQVGWTLTHELYFYLVYGLVLVLPARGRAIAALVWGGASLAALLAGWEPHPVWLALAISPFNLQFLAGVLLAEFEPAMRRRRLVPLILALAGAAMALVWAGEGGIDRLAASGDRVLILSPFAIGLVWTFLAWRPALPRAFEHLGDASYALYLSHLLVIGVLARLLPDVLDGSFLASPVYYSLGLAACLAIGLAAHHLLERPLLRLGKHWIGRVGQ